MGWKSLTFEIVSVILVMGFFILISDASPEAIGKILFYALLVMAIFLGRFLFKKYTQKNRQG